MARLLDICSHVRSKNAGPFWVTLDIFFKNSGDFEKYSESEKIGPAAISEIFGVDPTHVKSFRVAPLNMVKISYARPQPQAWEGERDMHSGQQFVRLAAVEF